MRDVEKRALPAVVEFRSSDTGPGQLVGYAAKYGTISQDLGGFVETIRSGAFDKSLSDGPRVVARFNHSDEWLLGATDSGSLHLEADGIGLRYTVDLPDTQAGRDVAALAARGDVRFSSFAFRTVTDSWSETERGYPLRALDEVKLVDVAPVVSPAYLDTSVAKRSLADALHIPVDELDTKTPEDVIRALSGPTEAEPRDTHSADVVARMALELQLDALL